MYTMYIDHIPPPTNNLQPSQDFSIPINNPLTPSPADHVLMGIGSSTGAWTTYQQPDLKSHSHSAVISCQ